MVVVGDAGAGSIFCLDLYTRQTRFVARVAAPSGMALRRAPDSQRLVYITDAAAHRLYVVDIDSLASSAVAGFQQLPQKLLPTVTPLPPPPHSAANLTCAPKKQEHPHSRTQATWTARSPR